MKGSSAFPTRDNLFKRGSRWSLSPGLFREIDMILIRSFSQDVDRSKILSGVVSARMKRAFGALLGSYRVAALPTILNGLRHP
jgi:hypothetical protein